MKKVLPLVTAHSGCLHTPANTIESVIAGLESGADYIEVDVRSTKDNIAVLSHDAHIKTPEGGVASIHDLYYDEIKSLKDVQVTPLEDVLQVGSKSECLLNLDLKNAVAASAMIKTVRKYNMSDFVIISGCDAQLASAVKRDYPEIQVLLNADHNKLMHIIKQKYPKWDYQNNDTTEVLPYIENEYENFVITTCRDAIIAGCCGININFRACYPKLVNYARLRSLPVYVWTIDCEAEMDKYIDMQVHSITSNNVLTLISKITPAKTTRVI